MLLLPLFIAIDLRTLNAVIYFTPTMSESPRPLSPMLKPIKEVFGNAELLGMIVRNLDNGRARDLVTALQVSRAFFHASATTLCRRVQVPHYEFSRTKERDPPVGQHGTGCSSCTGDQLDYYAPTRDVTAHRAMEPGLSRRYVQMVAQDLRSIFPATPAMKELYKHVHVVTVDPHKGCDHLAIAHPLPMVRTEPSSCKVGMPEYVSLLDRPRMVGSCQRIRFD